jgi:hypothetical protein
MKRGAPPIPLRFGKGVYIYSECNGKLFAYPRRYFRKLLKQRRRQKKEEEKAC